MKNNSSKNNTKFLVSLFSLLFSAFLLIGQGTVQSADGTNLLSVTKNIVENGTFAIKEAIKGSGGFATGYDGQKYSAYAPGVSIFLIPFYLAAKGLNGIFNFDLAAFVGLAGSIFNPIVCSFIGVVLFLWCRKLGYSPMASCMTVFAYSFLTMNLAHSKELTSHPMMSLFILLSCYYIYPAPCISNRNSCIGGFYLGLAILTRYESAILVPFLIFFIFLACPGFFQERIKKAGLFIFFISISAGLILLYNHYRFGKFLSVGGYSANENIAISNLIGGFYNLFFSSGLGLIPFNPILFISFFGCVKLFSLRRNFMLLFLLVVVSQTFFYASVETVSRGVFFWGPRHLLPILPFLIIPIGILNIKEMSSKMKFITFSILMWSLVIQLSSITVNPSRYYQEIKYTHPGKNIYPTHMSINKSIMVQQWKYIVDISKKMRNKSFMKAMEININHKNNYGEGIEFILKNNISLNVFNFWWVYMYLAGFSFYLIGGALLLLTNIVLISTVIVSGYLKTYSATIQLASEYNSK